MSPIDSTAEILIWKHLNKSVDEKWLVWSYEMLKVGFDTEHLVELVGITKPYNQFELETLTSKVFEELNLDYSNREKVIYDYVLYLGNQIIEETREIVNVLRSLKDLCIVLNNEESLFDFYLLYFAKEDLNQLESQHYWEGADSNNIDKIVLEYFKDWGEKNKI